MDVRPSLKIISDVYEQHRQQADQVAILEADNQLNDLGTKLLYDPQTGVMHARGKTALDASQGLQDAWTKEVGAIEAKMKGDYQRAQFRARAQNRWSSINEAVERHVGGELKRYDDETTKSAVTNRLNDALNNFSDPEKVQQAIQEQKAILTDYARRAGQPPEWVEEQVRERASQTHVGVLTRMLAVGDDLMASKYYAQYGSEIVGSDKATIERALEEGSSEGQAHRTAQDILSKAPDLTRTGARDAVSGIENDAVRRKTLQNLNDAISAREADERATQDELFNQASLGAEQGKRPDPATWVRLSHNQRAAINDMLENAKAGRKAETDWGTYYGLIRMATDPRSRRAFLQRNLLLDKARLGDVEFKELARMQKEINDGRSADDVLRGHLTVDEVVRQATDALYPEPPKKGTPEFEQMIDLSRAIDRDIIAWRASNGGKEVPTDIAEQIADRHTMKLFVERPWYLPDKEKLATDLSVDERGRSYVPMEKIPEEERAAIVNVFRSRGVSQPDDRTVERVWAATLLGDRKMLDDLLPKVARPNQSAPAVAPPPGGTY